MTATAPPPVPDGDEGSGSLPSVLRTKRTIALLRICVLAVVTVLYLSSVGVRRVAGPGALLLIGAFVYALVCLVLSTRGEESSVWGRVVTLAIDVALITAWIESTGGGRSEFWTLFLIVIVAVALRFGIIETVAVAVGLAVLLMVLLVENGVLWTSRLYRPTLLLVAGFAIGVLSLQRADQRQRRYEMEAIAESRARQLGRERAEVERLRRVDLARTEFVGVAAHELRTPLAAILGVLSTLKQHGAVLEDEMRVELIDGAETQAERLTQAGGGPAHGLPDPGRGPASVDGAGRPPRPDLGRSASIEHYRSGCGSSSTPPLGWCAMPTRSSASSRTCSTTPASTRPRARRSRCRSCVDDRRVAVEVRNAGGGIAEEDREAIFERFRRADETGAPGTGLGLYISRGLVRAHGGELEVGDPPEEGGTRFTFWLPVLDPGEHEVEVGPSEVSVPVDDDTVIESAVNQVTVPSGGPR